MSSSHSYITRFRDATVAIYVSKVIKERWEKGKSKEIGQKKSVKYIIIQMK